MVNDKMMKWEMDSIQLLWKNTKTIQLLSIIIKSC